MSPLTVGFDLGGTNIRGVATDADGRVVAERHRPSRDGAAEVVAELADLTRELMAAVDGVAAVGVGAAGLVDFDGVVRSAPNIGGLAGFPLRDRLEESVGLPVVVDNDANAAALGELRHGAARGRSEVLLVTLGTGVGGGIVTGGQVLRGATGLAAEIGHFTVDPDGPRCACGARGHWESFASGSALGRMGREAAARGDAPAVLARAGGAPSAVTGEHVGASATDGEADGLALLDAFAAGVAVGLGGLVNILDPELIVVSGGLAGLGAVLLDRVAAALPAFVEAPERRPVPPVVGGALGELAGAVGAATMAREHLLGRENPP